MDDKPKMEEYDHLQNLPDELLTLVFAKLINNNQDTNLADIKFLCRCSLVSKRFNANIPFLSTLSITHWSIGELYDCCPKILKKFKYIRLLCVKHGSPLTLRNFQWRSTCEVSSSGHSTIYCMSALSYNSIKLCPSTDDINLITYPVLKAPRDAKLLSMSTENYVFNMLQFHDRLIKCIRSLQLLCHVEVSDFRSHGSLILESHLLNVLRYSSYNKLKSKKRKMSCFIGELPLNGIVMEGVTMKIVQKFTDDTVVANIINDDNIPLFDDLKAGKMLFSKALVNILKYHRHLVQTGCSRLLAPSSKYQRPYPVAPPITGVYTEEPLNFGMGFKDELSPYVGHMLHVSVERKRRRRDDYIKNMYSDDPDVQMKGTKDLARLLAEDRRLGDLRSEDVHFLIGLLKHQENPKLQFEAAFALTNVDSNGGQVMKSEAIPLLVDLMISKHRDIRVRGLITLMRITYDFPESIRDLREIEALQLLEDVVICDRSDSSVLLSCATFLAIVCRGKLYLTTCEIRVALRTVKVLLQYGDDQVERQALSALSYLSHGNYVAFEGKACKFVLGLISHVDPLIVIPTLQIVGNILAWGSYHQIQFILEKGLLQRLHTLLHRQYKIVKYEACRIIQSIDFHKEIQKKTLPLGDFKIDKKEGTNLCSIIEKKDGEKIDFAECTDDFVGSLPSKVYSRSLSMSSVTPLSSIRKEVHTFSKLKWMAEYYIQDEFLN
ncbi:hypothetical protein POM88_031082 [Heracleum sosnowskyi]|uniref:F-box domain-containing protein n=1 Tax=Heracleum sosnowskyi TaxID=360622 RepID=A0AAD8HWQ7_9APIA|nr:hypothetical protein POM88_031082 [Heracleum sosnowskyi]